MLKTLLSRDFRHTALNQLWRLFSGPALLILIPLYLTAQAQGYWYTFISLAALAIFADMGFSTILLQFSAHEFAHLHFTDDQRLSGDPHHLDRIAALWKFGLKWSVAMGLLSFPIILLVGVSILGGQGSTVSWEIPWALYTIASVLVFINSILLSFIEGCNSVGEVQKIRFAISFILVVSTMILLVADAQLYALACSLLISALSGTLILLYRYTPLLRQLYTLGKMSTHAWGKEIFPLLWRYAISWISGYFIFQIFTPVAFHYYGAQEAGRIGLSIALFSAIFGIANIWMTIIIPKINILVAHKNYPLLDQIFKKHLLSALITYILGIITLFAIITLGKGSIPFAERIVTPISLMIIASAWLLQIIVSGYAQYMRAFKIEPLVLPSFLSGIYIALATWLSALYLPVDYLFLGFLSSYVWGMPWVMYLFYKHKRGLR